MDDSKKGCLCPKGIKGGHMWAHQGPLHSENIMHQLNYLWVGLDDGVMADSSLGWRVKMTKKAIFPLGDTVVA